jgi:hypothetical protein
VANHKCGKNQTPAEKNLVAKLCLGKVWLGAKHALNIFQFPNCNVKQRHYIVSTPNLISPKSYQLLSIFWLHGAKQLETDPVLSTSKIKENLQKLTEYR